MPCIVRFSGYKIVDFFQFFVNHQERRRLGGLEPSPGKASNSELFPQPLPLTGMETFLPLLVLRRDSNFPQPLPLTGMETVL